MVDVIYLFGNLLQEFCYLRKVRSQSWIVLPASLKQLSKHWMSMFWNSWAQTLETNNQKAPRVQL